MSDELEKAFLCLVIFTFAVVIVGVFLNFLIYLSVK